MLDIKDIVFIYDQFMNDEIFLSLGGDIAFDTDERIRLVDEMIDSPICDFRMIKHRGENIGFSRIDKGINFFIFHIYIIESFRNQGFARRELECLKNIYGATGKKLLIFTINKKLSDKMRQEQNFEFINSIDHMDLFELRN